VRLKILAIVLLVGVGVAAAGYIVFAPTATTGAASAYLTSVASVTDVIKQAVATGTIGAHASYGLGFGRDPALIASGASSSGAASSGTWKVTKVDAHVGDTVKSGTVLAEADDADALLQLTVAQADLTKAQAQLATDQAQPAADTVTSADNTLQQAQMGLDNAKVSLSDTKAQNTLSVQQARSHLSDAQSQLTTDQNNSAGSTVTTADKANIKAARQSLDNTLAQVGASNHKAQQSVDSASVSLASAQLQHATAIEPATAETLAADQAAVASAQQALQSAQSAVDGAAITAPADGVVTAVALEAGLPAPAGDALQMQVGPMEVVADFAESDLAALKDGQAATVTVTALGQQLTGTLSSITPVAASSSSSSVVTYPVTITLDSSPADLHAGMSANVAVTTASATGVVAVPSIALQGRSGNYSVRVLDDTGQVTTVPVTVGLTTSSLAEIQTGLTGGESVIVGSATARTGTTTTSAGGFGGLGGLGGGGAFPGGGTFRGTGGGTPR